MGIFPFVLLHTHCGTRTISSPWRHFFEYFVPFFLERFVFVVCLFVCGSANCQPQLLTSIYRLHKMRARRGARILHVLFDNLMGARRSYAQQIDCVCTNNNGWILYKLMPIPFSSFFHYYSYLRYQWGNDVLHFEIINSVIIAWTRIEWAHTIPDTHMEPISGTQGILFKSIIIGWLLLSDNINQFACWHTRVPTSCIHFICIIIRKTYEVFPFRCAICYSFARAQIAVNTSITNQDHGLHISAKTPLTCIWGSSHMTGQCRWIKRKY